MKPIQLSTFTYDNQDFDVLVNKGEISYIFEKGDKRYGNKVKIAGKTTKAVVEASFNLLINMIETYGATK